MPISPEQSPEPDQRVLDMALDQLEEETPDHVSRAIRWLRNPRARWVRLPMGLLLVIGGLLAFLPVLGIEMLPVGLLLIAIDVPMLKGPVGRATLWLENRWCDLRRRWRRRFGDGGRPPR